MGEIFSKRVLSALADLNRQTGQIRGVYLYSGYITPIEILAHGYRHETAATAYFTQNTVAFVILQRDDPRQRIEHRIDVVDLFGDQCDPVVFLVNGKCAPVTIHDRATRRRQQPQIDPVLICQCLVLVGFNYLELVHPSRQQAEQQHLATTEKCDPPGE